MDLAAIQLNMRVFSDQHLDDPVADVVPAVAVMVPMVAKHDHDALRLRSRWVEELMDGWIRAGRQLSLDLSKMKRKKKASANTGEMVTEA
jgi:hypothetical protein